jgi:hypothetical protein
MRTVAVSLLVVAALAAGSPAALAQQQGNEKQLRRASSDLPQTLFEPLPDRLDSPRRASSDVGG